MKLNAYKRCNVLELFLQVGITSWGLECGNPGYPGVYASVTEGLCFIDWATKCADGDKYKDFYNIVGCDSWIDEELDRLQGLKAKFERRDLNILTEGQKRKTLKDISQTNNYILNAEALKSSCSTQVSGFGVAQFEKRQRDPILDQSTVQLE